MIDKVEIMGKLGKSDHNVLLWTAEVKVNSLTDSKRIRDYKQGDFETMRRELCMRDWDELLAGTTCDALSTFKQRLVDIIEKHIPDKKIQVNKRKKAIWLTHKTLRLVQKSIKRMPDIKTLNIQHYMKAARAAHEAVKAAKCKFESKLAANIKNDTKSSMHMSTVEAK